MTSTREDHVHLSRWVPGYQTGLIGMLGNFPTQINVPLPILAEMTDYSLLQSTSDHDRYCDQRWATVGEKTHCCYSLHQTLLHTACERAKTLGPDFKVEIDMVVNVSKVLGGD